MRHVCDGCPNVLDDCYPLDAGYCDLRSSYVPEARRADGGTVCPACGEEYRKHPGFPGATWATVLCSGEVVKL